MKNRIRISAVLLCLAPVLALSQDWNPGPIESFTLDNGLQVVLYRDTTLPLAAVDISYRAGSQRDVYGKHGLANLAGTILASGTPGIPLRRMMKIMDSADATYGFMIDVDRLQFWSLGSSASLRSLLHIEADRMQFPPEDITQALFDSTKQFVLHRLEQKSDAPSFQMKATIYQAMYPPDHPYAYLSEGLKKDLALVSVQDVRDFIRSFIRPNTASLCIGGNISFVETRKLVEDLFGSIPGGETQYYTPVEPPAPMQKPLRFHTAAPIKYTALSLIWHSAPMGSVDEAALFVLARILAGTQQSRLQKALVQKNLARSVQTNQMSLVQDGMFWCSINSGQETNLLLVYNTVMNTLQDLMTAPPTRDEVQIAANTLQRELYGMLEMLGGPGSRTYSFNTGSCFLDDPAYMQKLIRDIRTVTPPEISRVARKYLRPTNNTAFSLVPATRPGLALPEE
ncbi:MAG: insulinase family protein [Chlorobi bacterium]|nr:insulinase family protein [Chlorobiota bacterium]